MKRNISAALLLALLACAAVMPAAAAHCRGGHCGQFQSRSACVELPLPRGGRARLHSRETCPLCLCPALECQCQYACGTPCPR